MKSVAVSLLFPPGWTLYSGGPHLALPLLGGMLKTIGCDVRIGDLNAEAALRFILPSTLVELDTAVQTETIEALNARYFEEEEALRRVAGRFGGDWDLRLGFSYRDLSPFSSRQSLLAAERESPFTEYYRELVVPRILAERPDIIGLGIACIQQMVPALQLCRALREAGCSALIVFGGNTISRLADALEKAELFRWVDGFAVLQGEKTFLALCEAVRAGGGLAEVPNLIWWDGSRVRRNAIDNVVDPDGAAPPCFDGMNLDGYWGEPFLPLLSARGCYYAKCAFCAIPFGWGSSGFAGFRSPGKVADDIEALLARYGVSNFKLVEEATAPATIRSLAAELERRGISVQWEAYVRMERAWIDSDLAEVAAAGGMVKAYFGVELASGGNRSALNKRDADDPLAVFRRCHEAGILVHMFAMVGFPGTTPEDARRTVEFALEHRDLIDTLDIFAYGYARGTAVPPGVKIVRDPDLDWALEYPFEPIAAGILSSEQVTEMTNYFEEIAFKESPRLLHPTYRLVSPWRRRRTTTDLRVAGAAVRGVLTCP